MAVLETIRVKLGILITVLIAVALLSFIIDPSTLQSVSSSMSSKYDVGEIDGKSISYTDFQTDVDKFTTINEIITGSSVQNEQQQISIRDAAWQSLIDKHLFVKNAKAAGLSVGEEEMVDIISGEINSNVISQNPAFLDENGNFSREALLKQVWGFEYFGDVRTVDVTVRRLREKIEDNSSEPEYIVTKRGLGYYFNGSK